jgi:hypothetical protein
MDMLCNPDFSAGALTATQQMWYAKILDGITNSSSLVYDPILAAQSGDVYQIGRALGADVAALLEAFRAVGDIVLLETADAWMWVAFGMLSDIDADGFTEWPFLIDPESEFYGTDGVQMDKMIAQAIVAQFVYALKLNLSYLSADALAHSAAWDNWLQTSAIPDYTISWLNHAPELAHPLAASVKWFYYIYKLYDNAAHRALYEDYAIVFHRMMINRDGAWLVDHNCIELRYRYNPIRVNYLWDSMGVQESRYFGLTFQSIIPLAMEGVYPFSLTGLMAEWALTIERFLRPATPAFCQSINNNVMRLGEPFAADSATGVFDYSIWESTPLAGAGYWDSTGAIDAFSDDNIAYFNARSTLIVPCYRLLSSIR